MGYDTYDGFVRSFDPYWKRIYYGLLDKADRVVYTAKEYEKGCYYLRDRQIVDSSSRLICYYDGKPGGTAYTVAYALQKNVAVVNVADKLLLLRKEQPRLCFQCSDDEV